MIVTRHLIEQQYYTRGRQGIFRSNEGYDTVAKSPRLDNSFIKKALHPFCVYDAPRELQEREADPREYPDALICFRAETGELVIGQSVYLRRRFYRTAQYVFFPQLRDPGPSPGRILPAPPQNLRNRRL